PGSIVPFAMTETALLSTYDSGKSKTVELAGFGANSEAIEIYDGTFTLPVGNGYQLAFTAPYDAKLESLYITVDNLCQVNAPHGTEVRPYVALAKAEEDSNKFRVIRDTETRTLKPFKGGRTYEPNTVLYGHRKDIDVHVKAGDRMAIVCGFKVEGDGEHEGKKHREQKYFLYFSGGLLLK
ncbi:MAG: hypothetical protein FWH16_05240, partial [Oscillospiraceae bacterium]|nr:hypothetical protein [Oscillospiraceae bacterium]